VFLVNASGVLAVERALNPAAQRVVDGHLVVDLRNVMNSSIYDDGRSENGKGGWTDEGMNDFHVYPPLSFGPGEYHGYFFDFVNPDSNDSKNLMMTGAEECRPDLPRQHELTGLDVKGKYIFVLHAEGRIAAGKGEECGKLTLSYSDGATAELPLRMGMELNNWWQMPWWNSYEFIHQDAPDELKRSGADPGKFVKQGGTREEWVELMLEHSDAIRFPVIRGMNAVSMIYNARVVLWALRWKNPRPEKTIASIGLQSNGKCLIAVAAITITDTDFSLRRKNPENEMAAPVKPPSSFTDMIQEWQVDAEMENLLKSDWSRGIRGVEMRSDRIVTVRIDHMGKMSKLRDINCYIVSSSNDPGFTDGLKPAKVSRFGRGSTMRSMGENATEFAYMFNWMHLEMPERFKAGKRYSVKLVNGLLPESGRLRDEIEFSLEETPNPSFKLNQVGYSGAAETKHVYLSSYLGDGRPVDLSGFKRFEIRDAKNGRKVFGGEVKPHVNRDRHGLDKLYLLDISGFDREGTFYIWIDGLGRSYDFKNGDIAAREIYDVIARGMYFQRSGIEIKPPWGGQWRRPMCHARMYVTPGNIGFPWDVPENEIRPDDPESKWYAPGSPHEFHGGHYDAGDFDLRPMHIRVPTYLMTLYSSCPEKFFDGQTLIPENSNGIPDILDEAAYNLLAYEYCQDFATKICNLPGGVAPGNEGRSHPVGGFADDKVKYYMRGVTPYFSFSAAAAFSQAARTFEPFDGKRAGKYLKRAKAAYGYAVEHKDEECVRLSHDQGEYWDASELSDAWCWAAGELFAATGEKEYLDQFLQRYRNVHGGVAGAISKWQILWAILTTNRDGVDTALREEIEAALRKKADEEIAFMDDNARRGYRASLYDGGRWGRSSVVVRNAEAATRMFFLTREQRYLDAIAGNIDFTLGMNPSEMSWMTGAGSARPMEPLNIHSYQDDVEEPYPGIIINGPSDHWQAPGYLLYPDKAGMGFYRRVVDRMGNPEGNEYSVWESQLPFMFAAGALLPDR